MMSFVNTASKWDSFPLEARRTFTLLLAPFAPHLAEELWQTQVSQGWRLNLALLLRLQNSQALDIDTCLRHSTALPNNEGTTLRCVGMFACAGRGWRRLRFDGNVAAGGSPSRG